METRGVWLIFFLLLLAQCTLQQTTPKTRSGKKDSANSVAIEELKKQISDIIQELNLLKEHQALQTVCLRGTKILGKCFLADLVQKTFHAASDDCLAKGGSLATPLSGDENDQLYSYVRQSIGPEEHIWLGINDMVTDGQWWTGLGPVCGSRTGRRRSPCSRTEGAARTVPSSPPQPTGSGSTRAAGPKRPRSVSSTSSEAIKG
ncbi:unnamed protein product [Pleuronectes platessa]|uniref:Uncharacterized protein n=1 Tax=Pleuronectes platessa TaxID=8262 RepID=A0A9N7VAD1_PLEPL|nr:unnamed protein product [Pleuronectes platessa]